MNGAEQPVIYMYHVTNVLGTDEQPQWGEVEVNVADDWKLDGDLVLLPVACFSTTLFEGDFPTQSPYPRQLSERAIAEETPHFWRVSVPFNPSEFVIIDIPKPAAQSGIYPQRHLRQIHLLCLNKNNERDKVLAEILPREQILSDQAVQQYFPGNAANTYGRMSPPNQKFFVNVAFINPVPITPLNNATWSRVERDSTRKKVRTIDRSDKQLLDWGERQLQSSWDKCLATVSLQLADQNNLQQIKWFMMKGKEALQKKWNALFVQQENQEDELTNDRGVDNVTEQMRASSL